MSSSQDGEKKTADTDSKKRYRPTPADATSKATSNSTDPKEEVDNLEFISALELLRGPIPAYSIGFAFRELQERFAQALFSRYRCYSYSDSSYDYYVVRFVRK